MSAGISIRNILSITHVRRSAQRVCEHARFIRRHTLMFVAEQQPDI